MPANSPGVEESLIGALLLSPDKIAGIVATINPGDFERQDCLRVYEAIRFLASSGDPLDPVLIADELKRRGELEALGGIAGINRFTDAATSGANALFYAERVAAASRERRLRDAIVKAYGSLESGESIDDVCGELRTDLKEAEAKDLRKLKAKRAVDIAYEQLDPDRKRDLIKTGFKVLDVYHGGGIARGSLTVIGAAPSVGKSQFAINVALSAQYQGKPARVLWVALEMSDADMVLRITAVMSGLHIQTAKTFFQQTMQGYTMETYGKQFERGLMALKNMPLDIIYGSFAPDEIRAIASRYSGRFDIMVVDYVQRCKGEKGQKTIERVDGAIRACKDIALDHNAAVIAVASLNRDGYREKGVKPDLAHLRETGNIEFDADNIWMLWREKNPKARTEELKLYIRKQRNGPLATIVYEFDLPTGTISEKPVQEGIESED